MARQYVTPAQFNGDLLAINLGAASLPAGVVDQALFDASEWADSYCGRRFGIPGATTLFAPAAAGATQLSLSGTINIDGTPDCILLIGSGGSAEYVQLGSLDVTYPLTTPYAGTAYLRPGLSLQYAHNSGEPVQAYTYEQQNPIGASTSGMDQYFDMTQAGQIAEAHAPSLGAGDSIRSLFLRNFPIISVAQIGIAYPWANIIDPGVPSDLLIEHMEGWIRFPIGTFNPPDSVVYITYQGGYRTLPMDVRKAIIYAAAATIGQSQINAFGGHDVSMSGVRRTYSRHKPGAGLRDSGLFWMQEAQRLLADEVVPTY